MWCAITYFLEAPEEAWGGAEEADCTLEGMGEGIVEVAGDEVGTEPCESMGINKVVNGMETAVEEAVSCDAEVLVRGDRVVELSDAGEGHGDTSRAMKCGLERMNDLSNPA